MKKRDSVFIWSDGWWIEDDKAWFVDGIKNILFSVDLNAGECIEAVHIPDPSDATFRLTPICIKHGRDVFCVPGYGRSVWVYNLDKKDFIKIDIDKPDQFQLGSHVWVKGDELFIVSVNWDRIIEVSISQKMIKNYHRICENDSVKRSVLAGNSIYMISSGFTRIYQFDLSTKKTVIHTLPLDGRKLFTICFDGEKFWLSGYCDELYIWDKKERKCIAINGFSAGIENCGYTGTPADNENNIQRCYEFPAFCRSVAVGEYVWFIPNQADKIIYVDKKTNVVSSFEIYEEDSIKESFLSRETFGTGLKYVLEYVRDDRYIGLFSTKNGRIFEIDTKELKYQWKDYYFSNKCLQQCFEIYKGIYYEGYDAALANQVYCMALQMADYKVRNTDIKNVGAQIYRALKEENIQ